MPALLRIFFFIGDLVFLNLVIFLSYGLSGVSFFGDNLSNSVYMLVFSNITWLFLVLVSNPYAFTRNAGIQRVLKGQLSFLFVHLLVVASLILLFKKQYDKYQIAGMYALFVPVFFGWKIITYYLFSMLTRKAREVNVLIIGPENAALEVKTFLTEQPDSHYKIIRQIPVVDITTEILEEVKVYCKNEGVDEIYCTDVKLDNLLLKDLINFGLNNLIRIKLIAEQEIAKQQGLSLESNTLSVNIAAVPLDDYLNRAYKRFFDIVFSSVVIVAVLSWLIPLIGLLIKLDSRGPIFFIQKRAGRNNRPFDCFKFRTMVVNSESDSKQATKDDARITKIGAFLRKSSLDEFPQFLNVFLGDMSIIGPRPHPIKLNEKFSPLIEQLMSRHYIKPGITGLAQAMGYRGETREIADMRNRVKLDCFYIENWSMFFDIRIIFQTVFSLIKGSEKAF